MIVQSVSETGRQFTPRWYIIGEFDLDGVEMVQLVDASVVKVEGMPGGGIFVGRKDAFEEIDDS